jgi:hypothetical protein
VPGEEPYEPDASIYNLKATRIEGVFYLMLVGLQLTFAGESDSNQTDLKDGRGVTLYDHWGSIHIEDIFDSSAVTTAAITTA